MADSAKQTQAYNDGDTVTQQPGHGSPSQPPELQAYNGIPTSSKPGAQLKAAREARQMDLNTISEATLVPLHRLEALERDDYEQLELDLYITGYIRKYAKMLSLPEQQYIDAYKAQTATAREAAEKARHEQLASRRRIQAVMRHPASFIGIAALAIAFTVFFIFSSEEDHPDYKSPISTDAFSDDNAPSGVAGESLILQKAAETALEIEKGAARIEAGNIEARQAAEMDAATAAENEGRVPIKISDSEPDAVAPQEAANSQASTTVTASEPAPATDASPASESIEREPQQVVVGQITEGADTLNVGFNAPCWVRVADADGQVLTQRSLSGGDTLRVYGKAPFAVKFGRAASVQEVSINGRDVTINPSPNRDILRLVLEP